jgi:membrane-bound lytic murein transglycosylase B
MPTPRRALISFALIIATLVLPLAGSRAADDEVAVYQRAVDGSFAKWLQALWPDAEAMGVSRAVFDANVKGLKLIWSLPHLVYPDPAVPGGPPLPKSLADLMKPSRQPEF